MGKIELELELDENTVYFTQAMPPVSAMLCHFRRSLTKLHNYYLLMVDIFFLYDSPLRSMR